MKRYYRGEVKVIPVNLGQDDFVVTRGERVAQMVIAAVVQVEELDETMRGSGDFGSTGRSCFWAVEPYYRASAGG